MGTKIGFRRFSFFFLLIFSVCGSPGFSADNAADKKEFQRIKREMREKQKGLNRADRKERSILTTLDTIDRDIQARKAELLDQFGMLRAAEAAFRDIEGNNAAINQQLAILKTHYRRRIRALYKMNRGRYATVVLSPEGLGRTLKRIKYLGMIAEQDRRTIAEYGGALKELTARQAELAEKKGELLFRRRKVEAKKAELEAQRTKKSVLLSRVRREKGLYEQSLRELEQASAELWAMIKKAEREKRTHNANAVPTPAVRDRPRFPWPINGHVLTRFGVQRHPQFGTKVFRRGIEIQAKEGEPVRAVRAGRVVYADWYEGYGKLVIVDHGSGLYTLYGNLSRLDLKKEDLVAGGQVLGLVGETGSLKGAKLYFELLRNGEAEDPIPWLAKR